MIATLTQVEAVEGDVEIEEMESQQRKSAVVDWGLFSLPKAVKWIM